MFGRIRGNTAKNVEANFVKGIAVSRSNTHRIIDVPTELSENSLVRNCNFPYSMNKAGEKKYKLKHAELKIEGHTTT